MTISDKIPWSKYFPRFSLQVCTVFSDKLGPGHQYEYVWVESSNIITEISLEMQRESVTNFALCLFTFSCPKRIA